MKKYNVKPACTLLSCLLIFGEVLLFAGCKNKNHGEEKTVAEDSIWFNSTTTKIEDIYQDNAVDYYESEIIGVYNDGLVLKTTGAYKLPDDFDWKTGNYEDYNFINIDYYTLSGELISSIDVSKAVSGKNNTRINDIVVNDTGVKLITVNSINGKDEFYSAEIDLVTGVVGEFKELLNKSSDLSLNDDMVFEGTWNIGEYLVSRYRWVNSYVFSFVISKGSSSIFSDLSVSFPFSKIVDISGYITVSDTEILLVCSSNDVRFILLNLETGEIVNYDNECDWINSINFTTRLSSVDGKSYITTQEGIKYLNFDKREQEEILSYNCCNLNRYTIGKMDLYSAKDDKYIFAGIIRYDDSLNISGYGSSEIPTIVVLEKTETNPNAGKVIITAASIGRIEVSYPICEAIRVFNDASDEYIVQLENNYRLTDHVDYSNAETNDELMDIYYKGASELSNQLAIDMISGNGPDIILNASSFSQIQSEDYLLDLNRYINGKKGIDKSDYFTNVIDAAKVDNKLLYMPVDFRVYGISTNISNVSTGQKGFTFDEYVKFVDEVCNGSNPISDTQLGALCTLYSYMSDTCVDGTAVNLDNESFRALCAYVKDNVTNKPSISDEQNESTYYSCFGDYLIKYGNIASYRTLLGFPSVDGRGPVISIETSIGISASATSTVADGAWEFIKICLGGDIQESVVRNFNNPVNQKVFDSTATIALENYNNSDSYNSYGQPLAESAINSYKEVLLSASVIVDSDPAILCVIREEIPPYFLDQKTLDEILPIIQNRVSTIIKERS